MIFLYIIIYYLLTQSSLALILSQNDRNFNASNQKENGLFDREARLMSPANTILYTHHVAINVLDSKAVPFQYCSGEIISVNLVITSASCIIRGTTLEIIAGTTDGANGGINPVAPILVSQVFTHPKFERNTKKYDIALLSLVTSVTLSSTISTISLPNPTSCYGFRDYKDWDGVTLRVLGFKLANDGASWTSPVARAFADMTVLSSSDCLKIMKTTDFRLDPLTLSCFSTTNVGGLNVGGCKGDLGGGVIQNVKGINILVGILTDYRRCGETTLWTRIDPMIYWIKQHI